ncbi:MAG: hypothetical protein V1861_00925 [Candidatus Micrarchaeota archaeon]
MIPTGSIPPTDPNFAGYAIEFRNQVQFFEELARSSWVDPASDERSDQAMRMKELESLNSVLANALDEFTYEDFKSPKPGFAGGLVKLALFMYFMDKTKELHNASIRINKDGMYALFEVLWDWVYQMLSNNYFQRSADDIIRDYLLNEAQFVAASELCSVELLPIHDAASAYQPRVFEKLIEIVKRTEAQEGKNRVSWCLQEALE